MPYRHGVSAERGVVGGTKEKSAVWGLHPAVTHVEFMGGVRFLYTAFIFWFGFSVPTTPFSMV